MRDATEEEDGTLPLAARDALASLLLEELAASGARGTCTLLDGDALLALAPEAHATCDPHLARALAAAGLVTIVPGKAGAPTTVRRVAADFGDAVRERLRRYADVLERAPRGGTLAARLAQADVLLRAGLYFEVHEVLEPPWRCASGEERVVLQGVIQAAVAWHHWQRGNVAAASRLASASRDKLDRPLPSWHELPLGELRQHVARWAAWLAAGAHGEAPPRPR